MKRMMVPPGRKNRFLAVGLAVALALAYAFFNLHAAWDPTTHLSNVRAGLVNEDQAVDAGGRAVAVGTDLTKTLLESKTFGWQTYSLEEAQKRMQDGELDFYLYIPTDASSQVLGLPTAANPQQAILTIYINPAYNYAMSQVAETLANTVREQLNGKIATGYLDKLLGGVDTAVQGIRKAADGARLVADGAKAASTGAEQLAQGLDKAKDGADQLATGTERLAAGATQVSGGASQVRAGSQQLAQGLVRAATGAQDLAGGSSQVQAGTQRLVDGYQQLAQGNQKLAGGIAAAASGVQQMKQSLAAAASKPDPTLAASAQGVQEALRGLATHRPDLLQDDDYRSLLKHLQAMNARAGELQQGSVSTLTAALSQLQTGLQQAEQGSQALATGAQSGYDQGQALIAGTTRLTAGAGQLAQGVGQAATGARDLAGGSERLAAGAAALAGGAAQVNGGTAPLAAGLGQLQDGGHKLAGGLGTLQGGSEQLAQGLAGAGQSIVLPPRGNAAAMSHAVQVATGKITATPKPGEALLAIVIPIALWLGVLALYLGGYLVGRAGMAGRVTRAGWGDLWLPAGALTVAVAGVSLLLGPTVAHPILLVLFAALVALTFVALHRMLVSMVGPWGLLISGLLLVVMPVTVGARAPYVLLPKVYQVLAPIFPLTHAVRGVQAAVAGGAGSTLWVSTLVLGVFLGLAAWLTRRTAEPAAEAAAA